MQNINKDDEQFLKDIVRRYGYRYVPPAADQSKYEDADREATAVAWAAYLEALNDDRDAYRAVHTAMSEFKDGMLTLDAWADDISTKVRQQYAALMREATAAASEKLGFDVQGLFSTAHRDSLIAAEVTDERLSYHRVTRQAYLALRSGRRIVNSLDEALEIADVMGYDLPMHSIAGRGGGLTTSMSHALIDVLDEWGDENDLSEVQRRVLVQAWGLEGEEIRHPQGRIEKLHYRLAMDKVQRRMLEGYGHLREALQRAA